MRAYLAPVMAASALALGGCGYYDSAYGGAGYGYSDYGYRDYGYYNPYYYGGYGSPYGGYSSLSYGWYGNSYYPGTGRYVYDRYRRPSAMTSGQRSYWTSRQPRTVTTTGTVRTRAARPNWSGFNRNATVQAQRQAVRQDRRRSQ